MRQRPKNSGAKSDPSTSDGTSNSRRPMVKDNNKQVEAKRSAHVVLTLFVLALNGAWAVYHYQFEVLPPPLTLEQVGKRGFSEYEAMKHVEELTQLGPHPVGSDALGRAVQYVLAASEAIKKTAHWEVDVEVDFFHIKSGTNHLVSGLFNGKTLVYSDLHHVVLRIMPKFAPEAGENAILVSSHIDTVFSAEGAGDCSSCVAVMLELARGTSQWAHKFKHAVIFLFNTGEEEGLNGAHSFITQVSEASLCEFDLSNYCNSSALDASVQTRRHISMVALVMRISPGKMKLCVHPWSDTVRLAVDLEAMGIGGKSGVFQAGPHPWAIENFAMVAKYPSAQIVAQDLFSSGAIKSATDFQVYKEVAGLSGLDFAFADHTAVYHTKNDKLKLLKPGSLQHLGENMLAFLLQAASSADLPRGKIAESDQNLTGETAIYFDILGMYMIVFRQRFAKMLYNSLILQSVLIWSTSLLMGGFPAVVSLVLSCLTLICMWIGSITFASIVAFFLLSISSSPVPFVSTPWLVVGLYGAPALLGALTGQHVGYLILTSYLSSTYSKTKRNLSSAVQVTLAKLDSERWIFKAGLLQWLILLIVGNYYKIGSSYIALVWLVSPAFAYGLLEATLTPARLPKPLKTLTLLIGLFLPFLLSSGMVIRLTATMVGTAVRFERNPGSTPEWMGNIVLAILVAAIVCLTLVYLLSYVHISGAKVPIILTALVLFGLSVGAVLVGLVPAFTEDTARAVNVVHVVDARGINAGEQEPSSFVSLFSTTPGNLNKEAEEIGGLVCGKDKQIDFVTFSVNYSCWTTDMNVNAKIGWEKSDIPVLHVEQDINKESRITEVLVDTKVSTRWSLAINTKEIEDFQLKDYSEELVAIGGDGMSSVDGWHIIQFSGGKNAPTKFHLTLFWSKDHHHHHPNNEEEKGTRKEEEQLLKLRTDIVDKLTPDTEQILGKLPPWCSQFGKSTSPHNLAFLNSLPVDF